MNRDEFTAEYTGFLKQVLHLSEKARREGLLSLEGGLDRKKVAERDIFEYGLSFVIDGWDAVIIVKILSNIINQEKDEYIRLFKTIQMEAVMGIQAGFNNRALFFILNSYTDIPLKDDKAYTGL